MAYISCQHQNHLIFTGSLCLTSDCWEMWWAALTDQCHRCHQNQSNTNYHFELQPQCVCFHPVTHDSNQVQEPALSAAVASSAYTHPRTVQALSQNHHKWSTVQQPKVFHLTATTQHHVAWSFRRGG